MPGDLKIVVTAALGLLAIGIFCLFVSTRPINPNKDVADDDGVDEAPEHPEHEARRRQI